MNNNTKSSIKAHFPLSRHLTHGKSYEVEWRSNNTIAVRNDQGKIRAYSQTNFVDNDAPKANIKRHLTDLALKRGIVPGVTIRSAFHANVEGVVDPIHKWGISSTTTSKSTPRLHVGSALNYLLCANDGTDSNGGKWAEVISKPKDGKITLETLDRKINLIESKLDTLAAYKEMREALEGLDKDTAGAQAKEVVPPFKVGDTVVWAGPRPFVTHPPQGLGKVVEVAQSPWTNKWDITVDGFEARPTNIYCAQDLRVATAQEIEQHNKQLKWAKIDCLQPYDTVKSTPAIIEAINDANFPWYSDYSKTFEYLCAAVDGDDHKQVISIQGSGGDGGDDRLTEQEFIKRLKGTVAKNKVKELAKPIAFGTPIQEVGGAKRKGVYLRVEATLGHIKQRFHMIFWEGDLACSWVERYQFTIAPPLTKA